MTLSASHFKIFFSRRSGEKGIKVCSFEVSHHFENEILMDSKKKFENLPKKRLAHFK